MSTPWVATARDYPNDARERQDLSRQSNQNQRNCLLQPRGLESLFPARCAGFRERSAPRQRPRLDLLSGKVWSIVRYSETGKHPVTHASGAAGDTGPQGATGAIRASREWGSRIHRQRARVRGLRKKKDLCHRPSAGPRRRNPRIEASRTGSFTFNSNPGRSASAFQPVVKPEGTPNLLRSDLNFWLTRLPQLCNSGDYPFLYLWKSSGTISEGF